MPDHRISPANRFVTRLRTLRDRLEDRAHHKVELLDDALAAGQVQPRLNIRALLARFRPWEFVTAPLIFGLIVPFVFLDLCVTLYQAICFPIFGLPKAKRGDYIKIDRYKLSYLNPMQKLNCVYCGYCNGLLAFVAEVAARTEHYFCPIKHGHAPRATHGYYDRFLPYDDGAAHAEGMWELKAGARACADCTTCGPDEVPR